MKPDLIAAPLPVDEAAHDYLALVNFKKTRLTEYWTDELDFIRRNANEKRRHAHQLRDIDPGRSRFLLHAIMRMN